MKEGREIEREVKEKRRERMRRGRGRGKERGRRGEGLKGGKYYYGHEPTNKFATFQAKYFSNALRSEFPYLDIWTFLGLTHLNCREADLLSLCSGGIIFTRGSAGTRQEVYPIDFLILLN